MFLLLSYLGTPPRPDLAGYPPQQGTPLFCPRGVPYLGTPQAGYPPDLAPGRGAPYLGTPLGRVPPDRIPLTQGTPLQGTPQAEYPLAGYPPARPGWVTPPRCLPCGILGNVAKHYGIWVPPPRRPLLPCGETDGQVHVKTLPSRRTTYVAGKNVRLWRSRPLGEGGGSRAAEQGGGGGISACPIPEGWGGTRYPLSCPGGGWWILLSCLGVGVPFCPVLGGTPLPVNSQTPVKT